MDLLFLITVQVVLHLLVGRRKKKSPLPRSVKSLSLSSNLWAADAFTASWRASSNCLSWSSWWIWLEMDTGTRRHTKWLLATYTTLGLPRIRKEWRSQPILDRHVKGSECQEEITGHPASLTYPAEVTKRGLCSSTLCTSSLGSKVRIST